MRKKGKIKQLSLKVQILALSLALTVPVLTPAKVKAYSNTITNPGFETGNLTGWTVVSGNAFSAGDVAADTDYWNQQPYNQHGKVFMASGKKGDQQVGFLKSEKFLLGGSGQISFLVGGGSDINNLYVGLYRNSDDTELMKATGTNSEAFTAVNWDASAYIGTECYVKVVDSSAAGHINVDDFNVPPTPSLMGHVEPAIVNHDFEAADLNPDNMYKIKGWTAYGGDAFKPGSLSREVNWSPGGKFKKAGTYHLWNFKDGGDAQVGVLKSETFTLGGNGGIDFLIGGGNDIANLYVALVRNSDGAELFKETGRDSEVYRRVFWDASAYVGQDVYIKLVDNASGAWGHLNADDFHVFNSQWGNGLLGQWKFDENTGKYAADQVTNTADLINYHLNDGVMQAPQDPQWRSDGISGSALLFDGYSTWITRSADTIPAPTDKISVEAWVAPHNFDQGDDNRLSAIISQDNQDAKEGFAFGYFKHGSWGLDFGNGTKWFRLMSDELLPENEWSYVVATYDGNTGQGYLYLNGRQVASASFGANNKIKPAFTDLAVGKNNFGFVDAWTRNVFSGLMDEVKLYGKVLSPADVTNAYNSYVNALGGNLPTPKTSIDRSVLANDKERPQFHAQPPVHWQNEPNGPIYFNGQYHLFYQSNPKGPYWSYIQYGHLVSSDMVHWRDMPDAIVPGKHDVDPNGAWAGTTIIDDNNVPVIFYTAGDDNRRAFDAQGNITRSNQRISLARSTFYKDGDNDLKRWEKSPNVILDQQQGQGIMNEFRDPFIFKDNATNTWFMLIASGKKDGAGNKIGGTQLVYSTQDPKMENWTYRGTLLNENTPATVTIQNPDFEKETGGTGSLDGWTVVSGNAFSNLDVTKDTGWASGGPFDHQGKYHLWGFKDGGDAQVGVIKSSTFTLSGDGTVNFLIGGGNDINNLYVALVRASDGAELFKATGNNSEAYTRVTWNAAAYMGQDLYIKVVDNATGGFGHINVDDVNVYNYNEKTGTVWELPVMLPIGQGKTILLMNPTGYPYEIDDWGSRYSYYWIGTWNPVTAKFTPDPGYESPKLMDYGDHFTGPSGFVDPQTGRAVVFSILQSRAFWDQHFYGGYAHTSGLPRSLYMRTDGQLGIEPIAELQSLRGQQLVNITTDTSYNAANALLAGINPNNLSSNMLEVDLEVAPGAANEVGLSLRRSPGAEEETLIYYKKSTKEFFVNRDKSTLTPDLEKGIFGGTVDIGTENIKLHVFVDRSVIEAFLNNLKTITTRAYPTRSDATGLQLWANSDSGTVVVKSLKVWKMNSAYTPVAASGVSLNPPSKTLISGDSELLNATVSPSNATNKDIVWTSNNTAVATVVNGRVTAKATGTATITAATRDGNFTAASTITVVAEPPHGELVNHDFEAGNLSGWIPEGDAFKDADIVQNTNYWDGESFNKSGTYHLFGFNDGGDGQTGSLRSQNFVLGGNGQIDFLVGGGNSIYDLYIALVRASDGKELLKTSGSGREGYDRKYWDASDYIGTECYIKIVDNSTGAMGHINVDDVNVPTQTPAVYNIQNPDFESGNLNGWTIRSGDAFSNGDVSSDVYYWNPPQPFNQQGTYHLWGFKDGGDGQIGVLESSTFTLSGSGQIDFLIGGGSDINNLYVALVRASDGTELLKATGNNSESYTRVNWNASAYLGQELYIRIKDNSTGGFGHLNVDDFHVLN